MKHLPLFLLLMAKLSFAQDIPIKLLDQTSLQAEKYFGTDNYGSHYYIKDNIFYKSDFLKTYQFTDLQLGEPTYADIINPLKIVLFYNSTNTVVFLDRHLVEIDRVRFNALPHFKNLKFVTSAGNQALWLFNLDSRKLEVYNYIRKKTLVTTQTVSAKILDQKSNFNFCWLLTDKNIEKYNQYGSLLEKIPHEGFTHFAVSTGRIIAQNGHELYLKEKESSSFKALKLSHTRIQSFYLNDENLYLYNGEIIYIYKIEERN